VTSSAGFWLPKNFMEKDYKGGLLDEHSVTRYPLPPGLLESMI
jgi:hypothetical protein